MPTSARLTTLLVTCHCTAGAHTGCGNPSHRPCRELFFASKKIAFVSPKRQRRKTNLCGTTLVAAPRRPLRPTIRGRGMITALRRPCLLRVFSRSAGSSGVIFAADPVSASHQTGGSLGTDSLGLLIPILAFALYCLSFYHKSRFCQQENYTIPK